eukprot:SAG31_NODE_3964_length_3711_cov_31.881229_1_plen_258_part_00
MNPNAVPFAMSNDHQHNIEALAARMGLSPADVLLELRDEDELKQCCVEHGFSMSEILRIRRDWANKREQILLYESDTEKGWPNPIRACDVVKSDSQDADEQTGDAGSEPELRSVVSESVGLIQSQAQSETKMAEQARQDEQRMLEEQSGMEAEMKTTRRQIREMIDPDYERWRNLPSFAGAVRDSLVQPEPASEIEGSDLSSIELPRIMSLSDMTPEQLQKRDLANLRVELDSWKEKWAHFISNSGKGLLSRFCANY